MKAIICGNELVTDEADVFAALDQVRNWYRFLIVVETGKRGVEMLSVGYARKHGLGHERYTAPARDATGQSRFEEYVDKVAPEIVVVVGQDPRAARIGGIAHDRQIVVAFASLSHDPKQAPIPDGRARPRIQQAVP